LNTYDLEQDEVQRETVREEAMMEREDLLRIYDTQGLEAAMHQAEDLAIDNEHLDEDRDDPRLFTEGPQDRFLSQREQTVEVNDWLEEPPSDLEDTAPADVWQADGGHETWELDF
jgi:hypothetical protein